MRAFLRFEIIVSMDRHEALTAVAAALGKTGGWIVDHSLFSDVMAVVRFSLPGNRIGDFGRFLAEAGLVPDPWAVDQSEASDEEIAGQVTLTFIQGSGDLRRAVPAFH